MRRTRWYALSCVSTSGWSFPTPSHTIGDGFSSPGLTYVPWWKSAVRRSRLRFSWWNTSILPTTFLMASMRAAGSFAPSFMIVSSCSAWNDGSVLPTRAGVTPEERDDVLEVTFERCHLAHQAADEDHGWDRVPYRRRQAARILVRG